MANYLLLYHGGGMPETDEDKSKVMAAASTSTKPLMLCNLTAVEFIKS